MRGIWKKMSSIGLVIVLLATLLMSFPLVSAKPPGACEPWPECKGGGGEEGANPAIAFSAGENLQRLRVMDADGANAATIYRQGGIKLRISWSPDGGTVAFSMSGSIWLIDVSVVDGKPVGTNARAITTCSTCQPAWSPAGDEIAYVDADAIWAIPPDGGSATVIYTPPSGGMVSNPTWRADASRLAFYEKEEVNADWALNVLVRGTGVVEATYSPTTFQLNSMYGTDWARTQDLIAVVSGPGDIYTLDLATGVFTFVTDGKYPTWSPDDSHIAFQRKSKTQFNILSMDMSTGETSKLTRDGWAPDWKR